MPELPVQPGLDPGFMLPKVPPFPRPSLPPGITVATSARRLPPSAMLPRAAAGDAGAADVPHFAAPDILLLTRAGRVEVTGIRGHAGIVPRAWPGGAASGPRRASPHNRWLNVTERPE